MRRFFVSAPLLALLVALASGSCGRTGSLPHGRKGETRIVSLSPSITDILVSMGAGSHIVGTCAVPGYPPSPSNAPAVASLGTVDVERVVELHPTLCATASGMQDPQALSDLLRVGVPVVVYRQETLDELWSCMEDLGSRVGKAVEGRELAASCRDRVEAVRKEGPEDGPRPRALLMVGDEPVVVAGEGTFLDGVLRAAGFVNAVAPMRGYPQVDLERLVLLKPDVLIFPSGDISPSSVDSIADSVARITTRRPEPVGIPADTLVRPGPRTPLAVEALARVRRDIPGVPRPAGTVGAP